MNIENHFTSAEAYLEVAHLKIENLEYDTSLTALAKVYSHVRSLLEHVQTMKVESNEAETPVEDIPG